MGNHQSTFTWGALSDEFGKRKMAKLLYSYGKGKFGMKDQDYRQGIVCLPCPNPEFVSHFYNREKHIPESFKGGGWRTSQNLTCHCHQFHPHNVNLSQNFHTEWGVIGFEKGKKWHLRQVLVETWETWGLFEKNKLYPKSSEKCYHQKKRMCPPSNRSVK